MKNSRVVFFGTPEFAVKILTRLFENNINIVAAVTQPDQPKKRSKKPSPSSVKQFLKTKYPDIPIYQPQNAVCPEFANKLQALSPDLFVVVAYGEIIKQHLLDMPKIACINVHPSLLPKYRGAAPMQRALMDGVEETGVAIMHMVRKMDAGDVIDMAKITVDQDTTYGQLEEKLSSLGADLLLKAIVDLENDKANRTPQNESLVTYAPKIASDDLKIDWSQSAIDIHNQIRALSPKPGAFSFIQIGDQKKRLKIFKTKIISNSSEKPGDIIKTKDSLSISCGKGTLSLLEVQLEGKKPTDISNFMRGHTKQIHHSLPTT